MKKMMFWTLALAAMVGAAGCTDDPITPESAFTGSKIVETDIPWMIPDWGGDFTISLTDEFSRWIGITEWQYRIFYDGEEVAAGTVSQVPLKVTVPKNYTGNWRKIVVEGFFPGTKGAAAKWTTLVASEQNHQFIDIDGVFWAPGNLTLKDGKFAYAENPEELGLYFKHMSSYGVLSEGTSYSGTCYTPEAKNIALADIPEKDGDPCMAASNGKWRLPSLYEIERLYDAYDGKLVTINGVKALSFADGKLFLPLAGGYDKNTGAIGYKNTNGAYWYSGEDTDGVGAILAYSSTIDLLMSYALGDYTASVRCVRNKRKPVYVSHSPLTLDNADECEIQVVTSPGELSGYSVALVDRAYEVRGTATAQNPTAKIVLPENTGIEEVVYQIFVNGEPTAQRITQPGITDYGFYKSHTPTGTVPADAFILTVNCTTDMTALNVEVKADDGLSVKGVASKTNPSVQIEIPENTGKDDRILKIFVNGKDSGRSLTQERPLAFVVEWSPGYLTVKDGAYTFAGEQELGMYFKYKSRYGLTLDTTGKKYSGTAWGPEEEIKAYADVTFEEVDPCSLVAPAGTWRMPSREEWEDMFTYDFLFLRDKYRAYMDKKQTVYITPSGSLNTTGGIANAQWAKVWSTTQHVTDATKYYSVIGTFSSETTVFNCTIGTVRNQALMVRCVRDR